MSMALSLGFMSFLNVDLQSPLLSRRDVELLLALEERRQNYLRQGRGREAHGVASAITIVWQAATQTDIPIEVPDSGHGGLPRA
jgi:hypothetical protein